MIGVRTVIARSLATKQSRVTARTRDRRAPLAMTKGYSYE